jgi:hypothetical protein
MSSANICKILILSPTYEQGISVIATWKKAEEPCQGEIEHHVHVCGQKTGIYLDPKITSSINVIICFTAESQEDWEVVKKEWMEKLKDKYNSCRKIIAANKEEKSKKWFTDIKADNWVDLSRAEMTFKTLQNELTNYCKIKCETIF